jgi:hypothetical protein
MMAIIEVHCESSLVIYVSKYKLIFIRSVLKLLLQTVIYNFRIVDSSSTFICHF